MTSGTYLSRPQCCFKDETLKLWEETGRPEHDDDECNEGQDWDPEAEWWEYMGQTDNCGAIGAVMAARLRREKSMELIVRYPDYHKISMDLRQQKVGRSADST